MGVTLHGVMDSITGLPLGKVTFNGTDVTTPHAINQFREIGKLAKGRFFIISCYRTWTRDKDPLSTVESMSLKKAEGKVSFTLLQTRMDNKIIREDIVSCSANFTPMQIKRYLGDTLINSGEKFP